MKKNVIIGLIILVLIIIGGTSAYFIIKTNNNQENQSNSINKNEDETEKNIPIPINVSGKSEEIFNLKTNYIYELIGTHEVDGRQGIAFEDNKYYVSGSTTLSVYDKDWNIITSTDKPFENYKDEVNHIGDIDVYKNEIYAGVEYFMDGEAKNIQVAIYDEESLSLKRTYKFDSNSGQNEVSGIAIDPDTKSIWMCSWADGESGRYLYRYDLENGKYIGKYHLQSPPQWIQGIAYLDGYIYITADDGTADLGEADHIYRVKIDLEKTTMQVLLERTLDDVILQGEIEGLSFDRKNNRLLVSYNRGAQIVLGMPKGFYKGYDKELHEVYIYDMK